VVLFFVVRYYIGSCEVLPRPKRGTVFMMSDVSRRRFPIAYAGNNHGDLHVLLAIMIISQGSHTPELRLCIYQDKLCTVHDRRCAVSCSRVAL